MADPIIQHNYPEDVCHCFGCGHLNELGHQFQSTWDGETAVCRYQPRPEHMSFPGYVYGGLIAAIIDCHSVGTAAAAALQAAGQEIAPDAVPRFVTGTLTVKYLKPTPLGVPLECRARAVEVGERKVRVESSLFAGGVECASGDVIAIRMPDSMAQPRGK